MDTQECPVGVVASWGALVASFFLSFATWVDLAELAGFDGTVEAFGFTIRLSWFMAIAVDGYVVSALVTWMAPVSDEIARFAKANTYAGAAVGVLAQSAYHALSVQHGPGAAWKPYLAGVVGARPPLAAGLSVHLRALVRRAHLSVRTPEPVRAVVLSEPEPVRTDKPEPAITWTQADTGHVPLRPDNLHRTDPVRDLDTGHVPAPRRPRPDPAWKIRAREIMAESPSLTYAEVAGKVMAEIPGLWPSLEAGRKAVSRLA